MYRALKENGNLIEHCYNREKELKQFAIKVENQLKSQYPKPATNGFLENAKYNTSISNMVHEFVLDNMKF